MQVTDSYLFEQIGRQAVEIEALRQQLEQLQATSQQRLAAVETAFEQERQALLTTIAELTERCDAPCEHCGVGLADDADANQLQVTSP